MLEAIFMIAFALVAIYEEELRHAYELYKADKEKTR